ncbi:Detected protein of unknown function [Hibiscus syriacus]|uniref:Uncharacterized protein n=1 Tax=Hibiscus syriacus TaxID=106335 RepID=A0A6A2WLS0_HIBSY|nr:Detected protein of unknown function [Hibiscus syriacus]
MGTKNMIIVAVFIFCIISSQMESVEPQVDCFDACATGCSLTNSRLRQRCERKCQIRCNLDSMADGNLG